MSRFAAFPSDAARSHGMIALVLRPSSCPGQALRCCEVLAEVIALGAIVKRWCQRRRFELATCPLRRGRSTN